MYRYGDGTPFPLDENFIDTLTSAVESCTRAFGPLVELDGRRERAREGREAAERELARLAELEKAVATTLAPYNERKQSPTTAVADKLAATAKAALAESRRQIDARTHQLDSAALGKTAADAIVRALAPFFEAHQLPTSTWIVSWDARGAEVAADAQASSGKLVAMYSLTPDPYRAPIRVDTLPGAEAIVVHMMKKGMFGKAKPAPIDLGKHVIVAFERGTQGRAITLKELAGKPSPGIRFAIDHKLDAKTREHAATWVAITAAGDADGEPNPLDSEDLAAVTRLVEATDRALEPLLRTRRLVDLSFTGHGLGALAEPKQAPLELLAQLTPLARSLREKSRMSGELVLKRDIEDGRREELFVPRAKLAAQFAQLPLEYRRPFETMGVSSEETQPAIVLPRPPPPKRNATIDMDLDDEVDSGLETDPQ